MSRNLFIRAELKPKRYTAVPVPQESGLRFYGYSPERAAIQMRFAKTFATQHLTLEELRSLREAINIEITRLEALAS